MNKEGEDVRAKFYSFLDPYFSRLVKALPYSLFEILSCYCKPVMSKRGS